MAEPPIHLDVLVGQDALAPGTTTGLHVLLRLRAAGRSLIAVQAVPDGHRILRLRLDAAGRRVSRVDVLDGAARMPDPSGLTIAESVVCYITGTDGSRALRRLPVR